MAGSHPAHFVAVVCLVVVAVVKVMMASVAVSDTNGGPTSGRRSPAIMRNSCERSSFCGLWATFGAGRPSGARIRMKGTAKDAKDAKERPYAMQP